MLHLNKFPLYTKTQLSSLFPETLMTCKSCLYKFLLAKGDCKRPNKPAVANKIGLGFLLFLWGMSENKRYLWTSDKTTLLIEKSKCYPELWNTRVKDFKNKIKKQRALRDLASEFHTTEDEIRRKLQNLRTQFVQELRKNKRNHESKWEFFGAMKFMLPFYWTRGARKKRVKPKAKNNKDENESDDNVSKLDKNLMGSVGIQSKHNGIRVSEIGGDNFSDLILQNALLTLQAPQKTYDDHQTFGDYVASELRGLKEDSSRKKLKRLIQLAILQVNEEDDVAEINSTEI